MNAVEVQTKGVSMDKKQLIGNDLTPDQWNELWVQLF